MCSDFDPAVDNSGLRGRCASGLGSFRREHLRPEARHDRHFPSTGWGSGGGGQDRLPAFAADERAARVPVLERRVIPTFHWARRPAGPLAIRRGAVSARAMAAGPEGGHGTATQPDGVAHADASSSAVRPSARQSPRRAAGPAGCDARLVPRAALATLAAATAEYRLIPLSRHRGATLLPATNRRRPAREGWPSHFCGELRAGRSPALTWAAGRPGRRSSCRWPWQWNRRPDRASCPT